MMKVLCLMLVLTLVIQLCHGLSVKRDIQPEGPEGHPQLARNIRGPAGSPGFPHFSKRDIVMEPKGSEVHRPPLAIIRTVRGIPPGHPGYPFKRDTGVITEPVGSRGRPRVPSRIQPIGRLPVRQPRFDLEDFAATYSECERTNTC